MSNSLIYDLTRHLKSSEFKEFDELNINHSEETDMEGSSKTSSIHKTESRTEKEEGLMLENKITSRITSSKKVKPFSNPNLDEKRNLTYDEVKLTYGKSLFMINLKN